MKQPISARRWFIAVQYIGLPVLLLLSFVSPPPGMSGQASVLVSLGILFAWTVISITLAELSYRRAETARKQQEQFTADISHDLRTPTAALRTLLEVSQLDPALQHRQSQAVFSRALRQVAALQSLTDRLLRLSRYETTAAPRLAPTNLANAVDLARAQTALLAAHKKQTIAVHIDSPFNVYAVADELAQLLVILLENAVKFSPKKSTITIKAERQRHRIVLSVQNSGAGIPADQLGHIFDRFYRADTARAKAGTDGFGLGLAIAQAIAIRHKTRLHVESHKTRGTIFSIKLRRA